MKKIAYYLPETVLDNNELSALYENWSADKIYKKTGINERRVAAKDEFTSDLAVKACNELFSQYNISPKDIDFIILVTQCPDYSLPTTACIVQDKLGIPTTAGAIDINLGCSGYIYGLSVAKAMILADSAKNVLLITADEYSKYIHKMDKSARTIFGDGATATFLDMPACKNIGKFVFGSDGAGFNKLIIPSSGLHTMEQANDEVTDENGNIRTQNNLYMNGSEIFNFTIDKVPKLIEDVLKKNSMNMENIDLFVFHQANKFMLDFLQKIIKIPKEKFYVFMENIGNTVSSSIPIAMKNAYDSGVLKDGYNVMLVGFGVGLSWGATIIKYN